MTDNDWPAPTDRIVRATDPWGDKVILARTEDLGDHGYVYTDIFDGTEFHPLRGDNLSNVEEMSLVPTDRIREMLTAVMAATTSVAGAEDLKIAAWNLLNDTEVSE